MDLLKLVVGGNPCKNFDNWCCVDMVSSVVCGSVASPLRSAMLGRNV